MELTTVWFILIAFFWTGYLVLEGFDFGVGMLLPILGRSDTERRVILNTIGPVWDGNEVWLVVAGGATFAAFPEWYATLFSGFYLPLFVILLALIIRVLAFEFRGKRPEAPWRRRWDAAIFIGSIVPAFLWGVALANMVHGVPIDQDLEYVGGFFNLLNPYALLGGLSTVALFLTHGAVFLALKTTGDIRARANAMAWRIGLAAAGLAVLFVGWTALSSSKTSVVVLGVIAALGLVGGLIAARRERDGWAFLGTAIAIAATVIMLFTSLFPDVMVSSLDPAWSLTTGNASSTAYTLKIMTWVAALFTPLVVLYQGWSYWVFRKRIGVQHIPQL